MDLDGISPNNPVILTRADGHGAVANSAALKIAGVTKDTPSPFGGEIMKDNSTGEPSGMLLDNAQGLVRRHLPSAADGEGEEAILLGVKRSLELGWCEIQNAGNLGALRADLWRYCALFLHGGVYANVDFIGLVPLREILRGPEDFVTANAHAPPQALLNGFIASAPRHPFMEEAIRRSVDNILNNPQKQPMALTGPVCLGEAVNVALSTPVTTRPSEDGDQVVKATIVSAAFQGSHAGSQPAQRCRRISLPPFSCANTWVTNQTCELWGLSTGRRTLLVKGEFTSPNGWRIITQIQASS